MCLLAKYKQTNVLFGVLFKSGVAGCSFEIPDVIIIFISYYKTYNHWMNKIKFKTFIFYFVNI